MQKTLAGTLVFTSGAVVMIFEIAGSRILGPYLGTSLFVWSGLIGVVMAALSLGYSFGGKISVKKFDTELIALIFFLMAAGILATLVMNRYLLRNLLSLFADKRLYTIVASLALFGPVSFLSGMILPLTIRIFISDIGSSGKKTGTILALSSTGSITGTALAGFVLLPLLGHTWVLLLTALLCALFSLFILTIMRSRKYLVISGAVLIPAFLFTFWFTGKQRSYIDIDTMYNRVIIYKATDEDTKKPVQILMVNDEKSSAMYLDNDELVFKVLRYYRLAEYFYPQFRNTLMIGGSGYAFPKYFLKHYPGANIDVVEIDPGLTRIAKKHFRLKDDVRLRIIHEDGRTFLNRNSKKYQVIYMDAYKSVITIPYQLTTIEAVKAMYDALDEKGIVLANIISTLDHETNHFLRAEIATYRKVFPSVEVYAVDDHEDKSILRNFMLIASRQAVRPDTTPADPEIETYLSQKVDNLDIPADIEILTDEYAPVDFYTYNLLFRDQPK